jgi:hypothetical protein
MLPLFKDDDFYSYLSELTIVATMYLVYVALCVVTWFAVQRANKSVVANKKTILTRQHLLFKMITVLLLNICYYLPLIIVHAVTLLGIQTTQILMAVVVSVILSIPKLSNPLIYNIKVIDKVRRKT